MCLRFESGTAEWKARTNPLSYGGPQILFFLKIKKLGHSRPLFLYFRLFYKQLTVNKCSIKVADDWIQTRVLWNWKRPLCQLSHNYCPNSFVTHLHFCDICDSLQLTLKSSQDCCWRLLQLLNCQEFQTCTRTIIVKISHSKPWRFRRHFDERHIVKLFLKDHPRLFYLCFNLFNS